MVIGVFLSIAHGAYSVEFCGSAAWQSESSEKLRWWQEVGHDLWPGLSRHLTLMSMSTADRVCLDMYLCASYCLQLLLLLLLLLFISYAWHRQGVWSCKRSTQLQ